MKSKKYKVTETEKIYSNLTEFFSQFPSSLNNEIEFHNFFLNYNEFNNFHCQLKSLEEITAGGYMDFSHKIFSLPFYSTLGNPKEKNALEIGFGAGRLMNPACKFFKHVYGIDIQTNFGRVKSFLGKRGNKNYTLIHKDTCEMDIKNQSIDFIYSYNVFDQVESWNEIKYYLNLLNNWLSPQGCGIFYFRQVEDEEMAYSRPDAPICDEGIPQFVPPLKVNCLLIESELNKIGFEVIGLSQNYEILWDEKSMSNLFYVAFQKSQTVSPRFDFKITD